MLKGIIWMVYFWFYLLFSVRYIFTLKRLEKKNLIVERDKYFREKASKWGKDLISFTKSKVTVIGEENIPKDGGFLIVSNHQSNMDIPLLMGYLKRPIGFMAKIELSKVPIFSYWMKKIGCVFIDRKDIRQSLAAINEGAARIKNGSAMVIFPEGTRSADGKVGEFKAGSLKMATKSKVPIIPITIDGTIDIMNKKSLAYKAADVRIVVSTPVIIGEHVEASKLSDYIKDIISNNLSKK